MRCCGIEYSVSYRNVRYARIDMRDGTLLLILPYGTDPIEFVERHEARIRRMYDKVTAIRERALAGMVAGEVFLLGRRYAMEEDCNGRTRIEDVTLLFCPLKHRRTREFLKSLLRPEIEDRIGHYRDITGLEPKRFFIREQATKWGSCSSKGNLNFNPRLVFVPSDFFDYIVLHELLHLRYMNHGKDFKRELKTIYKKKLPDDRAMMKYWFKSDFMMKMLFQNM